MSRAWRRLALTLLLAALAPSAVQAVAPQAAGGGVHKQLEVIILRDPRQQYRRVAVLARDWEYCYPVTGEVIRAQAGYVTDFASVPREWWWLVSPFGDQTEAAVVHDWLYAVGEQNHFEYANQLFRFALREQGVPAWKAELMYLAVHDFGRSAYGSLDEWNKHFRGVDSGLPEPPPPKPAHAAIGISPSMCTNWDHETDADLKPLPGG